MKLLAVSTRMNIAVTIILLALAGTGLYFWLKKEITAEMQEQLEYEVNKIHDYLDEGNNVHYPLVTVEKLQDAAAASTVFGDTLIFDAVQHTQENYYYLVSVKQSASGNYKIKVMTTYIGWSEYVGTIFSLLLLTMGLITIFYLLTNYYINKKIWSIFFRNLFRLKNFSVSSSETLKLEVSRIDEFNELQHSLQEITERSQKEYRALREFTEDAAHEIQTPLGIIQSKLDSLSQMDVTEEMATQIVQAKLGTERLRRLNKSLLLLAKLDNNAFPDKQPLQVDAILEKQLQLLAELLTGANLTTVSNLQPVTISANLYTTEMLLSNLLSNAIRYTRTGGIISIETKNNRFTISNPGAPLSFSANQLFQRFTKNSDNQSTGLGLSIVYQICELNGWRIDYHYEDQQHQFSVFFNGN